MKQYIAVIDKDEYEYYIGILNHFNFNHRIRSNGNNIEIRIHATSKDSIPYGVRHAFNEE